eukprot:GHVN01027833.1.p1 GENE.GHVN01027833.1~~GHVN01027833.1.p1  ORF type:complete len:240 (+),score=13.45 GHVN01027833.1:1181-1900(+)
MDKGGIYDYPKESNKIQHLTVALYSDADSGETKRSASGWVIRMETESGRYIVKWNSTTPEHPRIQSPLPPSSSSLQVITSIYKLILSHQSMISLYHLNLPTHSITSVNDLTSTTSLIRHSIMISHLIRSLRYHKSIIRKNKTKIRFLPHSCDLNSSIGYVATYFVHPQTLIVTQTGQSNQLPKQLGMEKPRKPKDGRKPFIKGSRLHLFRYHGSLVPPDTHFYRRASSLLPVNRVSIII